MIAAERILKIRGVNGDTPVPVQIQVPEFDRDAWVCRFSIGWPDGVASGYAAAMDAVQALQFAMHRIAMLLYISAHHKEGTLYFDIPGKNM